MTNAYLGVASVVLLGIFSGVLLTAVLAISPSLGLLGAREFTIVKQKQIKILQAVMTPVSIAYIISALFFIITASDKSETVRDSGIAVALVILALVYSAFTDIKYNARILKWDAENPSADWESTRSQWDRANFLRTIPVFIAFVFQVLALAAF